MAFRIQSVLQCMRYFSNCELRYVCSHSISVNFQEKSKMNAWQIHSYGGMEELQFTKSARVPILRNPYDLRIEVLTSSVNPIDILMMGGYGSTLLNAVRKVENCTLLPVIEFPLTLGRDFCGIICDKGRGVGKKFSVGEAVWGVLAPYKDGCHAEQVKAQVSEVYRKPDNLTAVEAGSLLYTAMTAWCALKISGDLYFIPPKGKKVLVLGGSGGVGTAAIQLLKAWGAQVIATCRSDAIPLLESLGADAVIDYTIPDYEKYIKEESRFDIILDAAGLGIDAAENYVQYLYDFRLSKFITLRSPLMKNFDFYGLPAGMMKNVADLLAPNIKTGFVSKTSTVRWGFFLPIPEGIKEITHLVEEGCVTPIIEKVYTYSELPSAYESVGAGHNRGKTVIDVKGVNTESTQVEHGKTVIDVKEVNTESRQVEHAS